MKTKNRDKFPGTDEHGREIMDPVPMAPPVGFKQPVSLADRVREMVLAEHRRLAIAGEEYDTPEEGDDFEVGDDMEPDTPYEEEFDPLDYAARNELRQALWRAEVQKRIDLLNPPKPETDNGNGRKDEDRRESDARPGSRKPDTRSESSTGADEDAPDGGGSRARAQDPRRVQNEDPKQRR